MRCCDWCEKKLNGQQDSIGGTSGQGENSRKKKGRFTSKERFTERKLDAQDGREVMPRGRTKINRNGSTLVIRDSGTSISQGWAFISLGVVICSCWSQWKSFPQNACLVTKKSGCNDLEFKPHDPYKISRQGGIGLLCPWKNKDSGSLGSQATHLVNFRTVWDFVLSFPQITEMSEDGKAWEMIAEAVFYTQAHTQVHSQTYNLIADKQSISSK